MGSLEPSKEDFLRSAPRPHWSTPPYVLTAPFASSGTSRWGLTVHSDQPVAFLEDRYRTVLVSMLGEKKAEMPESSGTTTPSPQNVINLMDALKRSLAAERPSSRTSVPKPTPRTAAVTKHPHLNAQTRGLEGPAKACRVAGNSEGDRYQRR
jgi:hypothetical protein